MLHEYENMRVRRPLEYGAIESARPLEEVLLRRMTSSSIESMDNVCENAEIRVSGALKMSLYSAKAMERQMKFVCHLHSVASKGLAIFQTSQLASGGEPGLLEYRLVKSIRQIQIIIS